MKRTKPAIGSFDYLKNRKAHYIMKVVLMFLIGLAIYITGYYLNKQSNRNVFTVIAILFVLPGAKALVEFIVLAPFKSVEKERYEKVYQLVTNHLNNANPMEQVMMDTVVKQDICNMYCGVVFTSTEKVMNLDFLIITDHKVIGLAGGKKQDTTYMQKYLSDGLKSRRFDYDVKIMDEEAKFLSALKSIGIRNDETELSKESYKRDRNDLIEFLLSLVVS